MVTKQQDTSFFPSPAEQGCIEKEKQSQVLSPNSENPRGKGWEQSKRLGTRAASSREWVTTACEEGVEGHRKQSPNPS